MNIPKAMVTSMDEHEDMIDYLSTYRTQDKMHGKHYVPYGALFWFECNQYGDLMDNCYFIKKVPVQELMDKSYFGTGYRKIMNKEKVRLTLPQVLSKADRFTEHKTLTKIKLPQ